MERDVGVGAEAFLAGAKRAEVVGGLRNDVVEELHYYPPFHLSAYAYVQVTPRPPHLSLSLSRSRSLARSLCVYSVVEGDWSF